MLTKAEYLQLNKNNFASLTKQNRDKKFSDYKNKYDVKNKRAKANNTTAKLVKKTGNGRSRPANSKVKLSDCLMLYAKASIDPFTNIQEMPCIPDSICAPSFKYRTFIDTDMIVGTEGVGFASYNPWTMSYNDAGTAAAKINQPLITTTATYSNPDYFVDTTQISSGELIASNSNSPYGFASINAGDLRLVAAGVEAEYTGQLLNQAGTVSVIQWDGLRAVPNGSTTAQIRRNQRTQVCPTSREARCYARYEPTSTSNYDYESVLNHAPSGNIALPDFYGPLLVYVSGATPGTTFRIRAVAFFELQLSNAPVSPSESDPIGFPAFQSARTGRLPTSDPQMDLLSILKSTAVNIGKSVSGFAPQIGTAIGAALGNPAMGFAAGNLSKDIFETLIG